MPYLNVTSDAAIGAIGTIILSRKCDCSGFLHSLVWGAALPCLCPMALFSPSAGQESLLETRSGSRSSFFVDCLPWTLVYFPPLEILNWRDRRPSGLAVAGTLRGALSGAGTVIFISGGTEIRTRERALPLCWLDFQSLLPGPS